MKFKLLQKFSLLAILLFLCSCVLSGKSSTTSSSEHQSSSNSSSSSSSSSSTSNDYTEIKIPSSPGKIPSNVYKQVSFLPGGGIENCQTNCAIGGYTKNNVLELYNFSANQRLLLVSYSQKTGEYLGDWTVQTNGSGYLYVNIENGNSYDYGIIIYDLNSRNILAMTRNIVNSLSFSCPGAPPIRLSVGMSAKVCTKSDNVLLRAEPKRASGTSNKLPPGSELLIIGGPICDQNSSWWYWHVRTEFGYEGWVAEGGDNTDKYFLCPIN